MRILFSIPPSKSHLYPIVPLAWALQGAGHEVCVATHPEMVDEVTQVGLTAVSVGEKDFLASIVADGDDLYRSITDTVAYDPAEGRHGRPPSKFVMRTFSRYYREQTPDYPHRPMVDDLVDFARGWRPDLVIWDPMSFPAPIAARASGAAHARILWSADDIAWIRGRLRERLNQPGLEPGADLMADATRPMLRRFGCEFREEMLTGQWTIDPYAARRGPRLDLRYIPVRAVPYTGSAVIPEWLWDQPKRKRVCLSLGMSIRNFFAAASRIPISDLFEMVADLDIELVGTLNPAQLASVGTVPDNVRLIDYLPLNVLLPTCSAIIHHGGSGTFAAAVAQKVPQLVWPEEGPYFNDIANYVRERGAGLVVDSGEHSVDTVKEQLVRVMDDPSFQRGATGLYDDMLAAPSPNDIVPLLEKLTAQHRA